MNPQMRIRRQCSSISANEVKHEHAAMRRRLDCRIQPASVRTLSAHCLHLTNELLTNELQMPNALLQRSERNDQMQRIAKSTLYIRC